MELVRSTGGCQIRVSICVKITDRYRPYLGAWGRDIGSRLERAVAITQKETDVVAAVRCYCQIQKTVLVDIANDNIPRSSGQLRKVSALETIRRRSRLESRPGSDQYWWRPDPGCRPG